ncbi:hypothetical protein [Roseicyclus sp.]|uniref:hypothetical protein n=1 Tax=Roseicyclus sp. TaxID=1914329 RepID=UPI003FA00322
MQTLATLVIALTLGPVGADAPSAGDHLHRVDFSGALSDAIDAAMSGGSVGQGNGNGNGNVGVGNGNNNSGNGNGNNNVGNNNGNNNSGNDNGNDNVGDGNGNDNSGDDNGNDNVGNGFGNGNATSGNGNGNVAARGSGDGGVRIIRPPGVGAAPVLGPVDGVVVCQRVRFLWMTELRCN